MTQEQQWQRHNNAVERRITEYFNSQTRNAKMAKHESEMHRQRRIALEALQTIANLGYRGESDRHGQTGTLDLAKQIAKDAINRICEPAANGLWADHRQMDLADRKDC